MSFVVHTNFHTQLSVITFYERVSAVSIWVPPIDTLALTVCLVLECKKCVCDRDALLASLYDDDYDEDLGELGRVDSRKVYARHAPSDSYIRIDIELGLTEG